MSTTDSASSSQESTESLGEVKSGTHQRKTSEEKKGPQILSTNNEGIARRKSVVLEPANLSDISRLSGGTTTSTTSATASNRRSSIVTNRTVGFDAPLSPRQSISPRASLSVIDSPEKKEEKMSEPEANPASPPSKRGSTRISAAAEKLAAMYEQKPGEGEKPVGSESPSGARKAPGKLVMKGPPPIVFGVRPPTEPKAAEQGVDLDRPVLSKGLSETRLTAAKKSGGSVGRRPPSRRTFTPTLSVADLNADVEISPEEKEKLEAEKRERKEREEKEKEEAEEKEKKEREEKEREQKEIKEREEKEAQEKKEKEEKEAKEREAKAKEEADAKEKEEKERVAKEAQDKLNQEKEEKAQKEKEEKEKAKREKEEKAQKEKEEKEAKIQKEKEEKEAKVQKEKEEKERAKKEKEEKAQKEKEEKEAKVQKEKEEKERAKKEKEEKIQREKAEKEAKAQKEKEEKEAKAKGKAGAVEKDLLAGSPSGKSAGTSSKGNSDSSDESEDEAPVGSRIVGPPSSDDRKKQLGSRGSMMIADLDGNLQRDFNSLRIKKKPEESESEEDDSGSKDSDEDDSESDDSDDSEESDDSDSESDRPYIPPTNPSVKLPRPTETGSGNNSPSQNRHTVEKKRASIAFANSASIADSSMSPEMENMKKETLSSMGEYRPLTAEEKAIFRSPASVDSNAATPVMTMTRGDAKRHASQLGNQQSSPSSRSLAFNSPPTSPKISQSRPTLFWLHPRTHKMEKFRMSKSPLRVGRNSDVNDVVIRSKYISRRHCKISSEEIQLDDGNQKVIRIADLESASGTYVNGHRLSKTESKVLAAGDRIRLGKTLVILGGLCLFFFPLETIPKYAK
eukprot:TRINITY_DN1523_c0_g1_i2.p1 TRINITY_DN1523_c0_g1~~TRINITY_DN1523_c0_g1_i2.p1  ORF type:complete len:850 (-),score=470.07 TRINITY_DN1523_c0_g1_i2:32-2581(-)